ncbi:MAG TPA: deoxyguanosinetriphosphate triphosphohydrolase [Dehalococcoidia bacterium]|nr:deoxyguanosinetriphosphate triphosphohydrolase [Dehalococcoidia bacterium]HAS27679.1 deoxyguanosinetriphosphate triphosphohydrolase [Dehalococcoidia bacterium]
MIQDFNIRQKIEERELQLSPLAAQSVLSRGRMRYEEPCPIRTAFQRDRDRIIHCKAFRRLKHKTQVFIAPLGDHYVTRLTHTLEVSQLARTIARSLNLNEDLTEAIGLGHDLGHTPFGHVGEEVLNEIYGKGFRHNQQSLRVVDTIENDGKGLNLTWEVRDGILNHSKPADNMYGENWGEVGTLEGEICKISDLIAYVNHDIGDAIRAGIITENNLPCSTFKLLGSSHGERVNTMVCDIIENSWAATGSSDSQIGPLIKMSNSVLEATNELRAFLFEKVYRVQSKEQESIAARQIVQKLYKYFEKHVDELPPEYMRFSDDAERCVVDYIAGMTDQYAINLSKNISF